MQLDFLPTLDASFIPGEGNAGTPPSPTAAMTTARITTASHEDMSPPPPEPTVAAPSPSVATTDDPLATLADLLKRVLASPASQSRSDRASAVRVIGKVLAKSLHNIPASPAKLSPLMGAANPMTAGVNDKRWGRVRSLVAAALRDAGVEVMRGKDRAVLRSEWAALFDGLTTPALRNGLSSFIHHASRSGIRPAEVENSTFDDYLDALVTRSLHAKPRIAYRTAIRSWNAAVVEVEGWPLFKADLPKDERRYALATEDLPAPFTADLDRYCSCPVDTNPFSKGFRRPLRQSTIASRRRHVLQVASALLASGYPASQLNSLKDLVEFNNTEAAMLYLYNRAGERRMSQLASQTNTLAIIAKTWVRAPKEDVDSLHTLAKNLGKSHSGLAPKVRERLRQLELPANRDALLLLPERVLRSVEKEPPTRDSARRFLFAMAVEFLTVAPIRIGNLTILDVEKHFRVVTRGKDSSIRVVIPDENTKNHREIELPLPPSTAHMVSLFFERYRPLITSDMGSTLFPSERSAVRNPGGFGTALTKFIRRETGLDVNPHLFRAWAATIAAEHAPGQLETARILLGHSSTAVTLKHYAHISSDKAFKAFDATIERLRRGEDGAKAAKDSRGRKPSGS